MRLERALYRHLPMALGIGAALLALNLVLYFTAVSKLDRFAKTVKTQVADNRAKLASLEKEDKAATAGVDHVKNNRQVVGDLANKILLTKGQRLVEVQNVLLGLADARRLRVDNLTYSYSLIPRQNETPWGRRYLKVDINLPTSGSYPDLKGFMEDVQKSPQFFTLTSFSMNSGGQGGTVIQGNFVVTTYFVATAADEKEIAGRAP